MAIVFSCACGQQYTVAESLAGKSGRCKKCGVTMAIPQPTPAAVEERKVVVREASAAPAEEGPTEEAAEPASEADEPDTPQWFEGHVFSRGSACDCRVYRVGDELVFLDAGPHVVKNRRADERQKEEAKQRKRQLDALSPKELLQEADSGQPNRRWRFAAITQATLLPPSLWSSLQVLAVLHLRTADGGKAAMFQISLDQLKELKAAAALLRESLCKENVTVQVPLTKKGVAKAEAKRRRTRLIVQSTLGAAAVVGLLCLLIPLFWRKAAAGHEAGGPGGDPGGALVASVASVPAAGFAVVDTPGDAPSVNPDIAKQKDQRRLIKQLADEAPPFDPAQPPTLRSALGHQLWLGGNSDQYIEACEKRLKGEPVPADTDPRWLDRFLRGQGGENEASASGKAKAAWDPIPIDKPSAPFKVALTIRIPLEPGPLGPFHPGVMNGPFFVPYPWWLNVRVPGARPFDLERDPKNRNRYHAKILAPYPPHPVIDVRDGKTVGELDWQAPVWANPRLSPDGSFLVGTDTFATLELIMSSTIAGWENGKDLLFIWAKGKKSPATFKVPGVVDWMEFVGNDRLGYVTYTPKTVLRIHDVAKNEQVAEIELPGANPAPHPDRQHDDTAVYPGLDFYRPMARRGAVSANGHYVALGCQDGVRLVSMLEGKVVGLLPVPNATWYRGLNFSADGARLFGFVIAGGPTGEACTFRAWSVATGQPLDEVAVEPYVNGPIFPGAAEGLYLANRFFFTKHSLPLDEAPFRIVRIDDDGTALVIGPRTKAPEDTPPPQSVTERTKLKLPPRAEDERKDLQYALFPAKVDWTKQAEKIGPILSLLTPRPPALPGNRTGIAAQKPEPPGAWTPPSFSPAPSVPEEGDDLAAMHQLTTWPVSFGDDKAARVRYLPKGQHRQRWEVWLDLLDRTTGKRAAPAAKLWDWAHFPDQAGSPTDEPANPNNMGPRPLPTSAALGPDAGLFALVDPGDCRRVDLFKPTGDRVLSLLPYAERRIDWLGWSRSHLLTVGGGRFTAWDPSSGKAVFEVDGDYTHIGQVSPDRQWVVLWTGKYADLLDAATGKCLGRCQAGGFSGRLEAFTLAPDGKRLAAAFSGWPRALGMNGPGHTAVVWNLETGRAGLYGFIGGENRIPTVPTCTWAGSEHLLLGGRTLTEPATLIDVRLGVPVGSFKIQGGGYVAGQPALGTPDGRVWYPTNAIAGVPKGLNLHTTIDPDFPAIFAWRTVSLPGLNGNDAFLADPAREWVDLSSQPVQVQAKVGTKAQSEAIARSLARAVAGQGFRIGPGGTVLRVEGALADSNDSVTFTFGGEVKLPQCVLSARWLSPQGNELWKAKTTGTWSPAGSKYKVSQKTESFGPQGGVVHYEFDFKGRSASSAMREELMDSMAERGGVGWLQLPELQFLRAGGQDRPVPVAELMVVRMPVGAK
jgi:hypothetical protein